ncbi:MAG: flippase [Ignavibacteriaceae bacterium]|nr:flippase [Ignavibacteriaceae bacterium]
MIDFKENIRPYKVLLKNFTSLSILQITNYLFPLITLPYLVRVLGPEKYGLVNFALAFTAYFVTICDYGFNLSATKEISINRENKYKISKIFSSVITIKVVLFFLSTLIFLLIVFLFKIFQENVLLYSVALLSVLGTAFFPLWFYQGIERMKYILIISVAVRTFTTVLIFLLIKNENDFVVYAGLNTLTQILIGILGLSFALRKFGINYSLPTIDQLKKQIKNGWSYFLSTIWISLYTTSNIFILGLFAPNYVVGYFAAADKIRIAFQGLFSSMSQSVFPYVNKLLSESYEKFISFNKKLFKVNAIVGVIISVTIFLLAEPIVKIVLGNEYVSSVLVLKIIGWLPLIIIMSNVMGIQTMLPLNKQNAFSFVLFLAAIINLSLSFILVPKFFEIGTSISVLLTEVFVTISFFIFLKRNKIRIL